MSDPSPRCGRGLGPLFLLARLPLHLLLLLQLWSFLWELDIIYCDVYLCDSQAGQVLDPAYHVAAHLVSGLGDWYTILYGHREIEGRLLFPDLSGDAAGEAPATARAATAHGARYASQEASYGRGGAAAHLYLLDLLSGDTGYLSDGGVSDGCATTLLALSLLAHALVTPLLRFRVGVVCTRPLVEACLALALIRA